MKQNLCLLAILLLLPLIPAGAQGLPASDKASVEENLERTLWFGSSNAAGLAGQPLSDFNLVGFCYDLADGDFRRMQEGSRTADLGFDTQGALRVGKFQLWGHFRYDHVSVSGASFNTVLYDPFDDRQVFAVADPVESGWMRQCYDMEFKAALKLTDRLWGGLHLEYTDRIGAKQNDPRSETFKYNITVKPSLVFAAGASRFGLTAIYTNLFERSVPVLSNASEIQDVFVLRGLGNYVVDVVGNNGLSTLFYRCNSYGGALQYGRGTTFLAELGGLYHGMLSTESATQPYQLGSTVKLEAWGNAQWLQPHGKWALEGSWSQVNATEYSQIHNLSTGEYEIVTSSFCSSYSTIAAQLSYDHYFGDAAQAPYRWKLGGKAAFKHEDDQYFVPESRFHYDALLLEATAQRRIPAGVSIFRLGADLGYNQSLGGEYTYSGLHPQDQPAAVWYPHDIEILTSNYIRAGFAADWARPVGKKGTTSLSLGASCQGIIAPQGRHRLAATVTLDLIF